MRTLLCEVVVVCFVTLCYGATTEWEEGMLPSPQEQNEECGRDMKSWICDPNKVLSTAEASQLDVIIEKFTNDTQCPCATYECELNSKGFQIAVAIIEKMKNENRGDESAIIHSNLKKAKDFTKDLRTRWDLGRCKEGVVIFYSTRDNVLYTMTDDVSGRTLTDIHIGTIATDKRQHFSRTTVFEGLRQIIAEYKRVLNGQYRLKTPGNGTPEDPQAVVGSAPLTLTSLAMLLCAAVSALLLLC